MSPGRWDATVTQACWHAGSSGGRTKSHITLQAGGSAAVATVVAPVSNVLLSQDEDEQGFEVRQCVAALREGKRYAHARLHRLRAGFLSEFMLSQWLE